MPEKFLKSYGGQTTDELLALASRYRIDSLVLAFEQAIEAKAQPSRDERYILAVEAIEREVNNGGYWQVFVNSSNRYAGIAEEAFQRIGCPKVAAITRDALRAIAPNGDLDPGALAAAAEKAGDKLRAQLQSCDDRYFANDEPIASRLFEWIKANRAIIRVGDG